MTERNCVAALALVLAVALSPARAGAQGTTCSGTLAGAVRASFTCEVVARRDGDRVTFAVKAREAVAGVKTLAPGTYALRAPLAVRTYGRDELAGDAPAVTGAKGGVSRASLGAAPRRGDVQLSVEQLEREANGGTLAAVLVRATLAPAGKSAKPTTMELRFSAVW